MEREERKEKEKRKGNHVENWEGGEEMKLVATFNTNVSFFGNPVGARGFERVKKDLRRCLKNHKEVGGALIRL